MKIKDFRVKNFKCFQDTGTISLAPSINIVTGQNNAGKTALLQALSCDFSGVIHLSKASSPQAGTVPNIISETAITLSISGDELQEMANARRTLQFEQPVGSTNTPKEIWQSIVDNPEIEFQLLRQARFGQAASTRAARIPSHGLFRTEMPATGSTRFIYWQLQEDGTETFSFRYGATADLGELLWEQLQSRIYRFTAERFGLSDCVCNKTTVLQSNAQNLAEVLLNLRANPGKYDQYVALVREILPQVKWIELQPIGNNLVRVKVWSIDKSTMREDLSIPLHECGTGVGQVLSMVYVAFTSEAPQVLLIDEPQSFLHPGAVRKLIEVLKRFPHHQYVISTHSAAVIAASGAPDILILEAEEGVSIIKRESTGETRAMQRFLEVVGARLSDVFGMDRVLWVEGPTEEKAIPLLLEIMREPLAGTAVVSIRNTGDLEGKDKKKAFEIYNNLTGKASILPKEIIFLLDREARDKQQLEEMVKISGGLAHFLPRRMFENFVLHPSAICAIANTIEGFSEDGSVTEEGVIRCLEDCLKEQRCWHPYPAPSQSSLNAVELDGAKVLETVFKKLSGNRVEYRKTKHSVELFKWIVENDRASIKELEEFLRNILHASARGK
jgi:hypothetical protein